MFPLSCRSQFNCVQFCRHKSPDLNDDVNETKGKSVHKVQLISEFKFITKEFDFDVCVEKESNLARISNSLVSKSKSKKKKRA